MWSLAWLIDLLWPVVYCGPFETLDALGTGCESLF